MNFNQKWVEQALKNFFGKDNITQEDVSKIKYLQIGNDFGNNFVIALSEECPPEPFYNTDGGEEWALTFRDEKIQKFLEGSEDCEETEDSFAYSKEAVQNWEKYKKSIYQEYYDEKIEDVDKWNEWYEDVYRNAYKDLKFFTGLTVLRILLLVLPDYSVFGEMKNLKALELAETVVESNNGKENLYNLNQLSCWWN